MLARSPYAAPLAPPRSPAERLLHAREDQARCLGLAAAYRRRMACGERGLRDLHAWALRRCRALRFTFPSLSKV